MRVLVGCEKSGVIREAFTKRGHDAWSCDLQESDIPGNHVAGDLRDLLTRDSHWDLFIAHPECRFLSNSGVLRLYTNGKKANGRDEARWIAMREAAEFFKFCLDAPIPRICVENPVMHRYGKQLIGGITYSQSIQPYEYGEDASKRTCLWLKGLPKLIPTNFIVKKQYANQTPSGQNKLGPSPERSAIRAKTYQGIADAMAEQWGCL